MMPDIEQHTESNRRAWDEVAEVRQQALWPAAEFFAYGGSILDQRVREAAGEVRGRALLHLQCATGEETLSWAVAGAHATGVDISERQIELARRKATEAGLACEFVASDIYALPRELQDGRFDLVYTGVGVLTWLPDIERWASVVAAALSPGGQFILFDGHPIASCFSVEAGALRVTDDYFSRDQPIYGRGWRHFPGGTDVTETKVQFRWPVGDVVTALIRAGMQLERLEEFPTGGQLHLGRERLDAGRLPSEYLLTARKNG